MLGNELSDYRLSIRTMVGCSAVQLVKSIEELRGFRSLGSPVEIEGRVSRRKLESTREEEQVEGEWE
jgi:hypothetical protein